MASLSTGLRHKAKRDAREKNSTFGLRPIIHFAYLTHHLALSTTPSTNRRNRSSPAITFVVNRTAHQLSVGRSSAANLQASFSVVTTSSARSSATLAFSPSTS